MTIFAEMEQVLDRLSRGEAYPDVIASTGIRQKLNEIRGTMAQEALLTRVVENVSDTAFQADLKHVLDRRQKHAEFVARQQTFIDKLRKDPSGAYAKALRTLLPRGLVYGEREWVPDEYQTLADFKLVECIHGPRNYSGLDVRELYLLEAGRRVLAELDAVVS